MVLKFKTSDAALNVEREDFCEVDGVMLTIPAEVPPSIALKYLTYLRQGAHDIALSKVMDHMVTKAGMDKLARCEAMTPENLKQLIGIISTKINGAMEGLTEGN